MLATHREEFEERILENLPLLILIGDHWNVDFAQILREQEDQTDRAVGKTEDAAKCVSHSCFPEGLALTRCYLGILQS